MPYKTIILELLQSNPKLHEVLRRGRMLLPAMESLAAALKEQVLATQTGIDPGQVSSAAMEIAVTEMERRLQTAFSPDGQGQLSLDAAMAFVRNLTSHA